MAGLLAIILGLLSVGETRIENLPGSAGTLATAEACRRLGATIERVGEASWRIHGVGVGGLLSPEGHLDFSGAETAALLLMGAVASHGITATFDGNLALLTSPAPPVVTLLTKMGAQAIFSDQGTGLSLALRGAVDAVPIVCAVPDGGTTPPAALDLAASALLLAGLNAPGETTILVPPGTAEAAGRLLRLFGADVAASPEGAESRIVLQGRPTLRPATVILPADLPPSSC